MWIIITKIPVDTPHDKIRKFVNRGISNKWFFIPSRNNGVIKKCGILRITNPETKFVECHGLVLVQPVKTAIATIEQLDGAKFNGTPVDVRRYIQRSTERDQRDHFNGPQIPANGDRRNGDRRRAGFRTERIYQS